MSEWLKGFIAGITSGLVLAMLWDSFKIRRSARKKGNKLLSIISQEVSSNLEILKSNIDLLRKELDTIFDENNIIHPLKYLHSGFDDLLKMNVPDALKGDTLIKIRSTIPHSNSINEQIKNREAYRNSEHDVSVYYRQIKKFDESLMKGSERLLVLLEELQGLL
ncbi:MAG: hypothetical protein HY807_07500 [Nitrospirae bacterium]|nr:hypothetical protein [Nitrospirota bacterium]